MADVGRPSEMTQETVNKLEEVFALDGTVEEACFFANISRTTYYNWINEHPELLDRFTALRNDPILKARRTLVKSLDNPQFALEYLKRKKKNEFSERSEMTGADGKDLQPVLVKFIDSNDNIKDNNDSSRI